jgi:hypothetical protein
MGSDGTQAALDPGGQPLGQQGALRYGAVSVADGYELG